LCTRLGAELAKRMHTEAETIVVQTVERECTSLVSFVITSYWRQNTTELPTLGY
jgi:hypothetical protein